MPRPRFPFYRLGWWTPPELEGGFMGMGHLGQFLIILPRSRLVIVRLGEQSDARTQGEQIRLSLALQEELRAPALPRTRWAVMVSARMAKAFQTWTILPHGPLEKLTENLWRLEGNMTETNKRVMSLIRLADGRIIIHNAIALEEELMNEITAWGTPAAILVPNGFHRQYAKIMKDRFPNAKVYCPAGAVRPSRRWSRSMAATATRRATPPCASATSMG